MPIVSNIRSTEMAPVNKQSVLQMPVRTRGVVAKHNVKDIMLPTNPLVSSTRTQTTQINVTPTNVTRPQTPTTPMRPTKPRNFGNGVLVNKGQKVSLNGANRINVCAGWEIKDARCDVDISAFMLDASRKIISDEWFVFYGQTNSPDNSLQLNCNGTQNDDKCISANLAMVNNNVSRIVFVLTIDEAESQRLNFSMIDKAYIRILDGNNEIIRFMLHDYYDTVTAMMLGELYRHNGEWKFSAIGDGVKKDLGGLCEMYGVQTE